MFNSWCSSLMVEDYEACAEKQGQRLPRGTAEKMLEILIKSGLTDTRSVLGEFILKQYGFRTGRSTIDVIEEVVQAMRLAEAHSRHC